MSSSDAVPAISRIVIAAPMKSGSSFVADALTRLLHAEPLAAPGSYRLTYDWLAEQNLTHGLLEQLRDIPFAINLHMMPHASNLAAVRAESITVIPLWRNLADMIVSFDDHIPRYGAHNPIFYAPEQILALTPSARRRYIIDGLTPWNIAFYLRWRDLQGCFQSYETLAADSHAYLRFLLWRLGRAASDDEVAAAIGGGSAESSRFNAGVAGRGALLEPELRARLERHVVDHPRFEEAEILLWELPWQPTQIARVSEFDGTTVQTDADAPIWFVSRGIRHQVTPVWLVLRPPAIALPREISRAALAALPEGIPLA
jgi:hypothetical protein